MQIQRTYSAKEINWKLLPDLVAKVVQAIPAEYLKQPGDGQLSCLRVFQIKTHSQIVDVSDGNEFLEFIRASAEDPYQVVIAIQCWVNNHQGEPYYETSPPYFNFKWNPLGIVLSFSRNRTETALRLMREIEETLELSPAAPLAQEVLEKQVLARTVFIAHAFSERGRSYAFQLSRFLNPLGFKVATGEGFSPESVSSKVKRRLSAQEVVIAVVSQQEDSTWITQESSLAKFTDKPLILLVESGVEFKAGILGDLEYIRFTAGYISEAFSPTLEGLRELGFAFE